jgi:hypothetical protein
MMGRPELSRVPEWYHGYIKKVQEDNLAGAFYAQSAAFVKFLERLPKAKQDYRYKDDKWTVKEVLQHIIDAERIFAYRALRFARKDATPLPGFDENEYAQNANVSNRSWNEIVAEFSALRKSTELMFASFNEEELQSSGIASQKPVYVLGIGFIIIGHTAHHWDIIKERYL